MEGLVLETERLQVRAFRPGDLHSLHEVLGDPEVTRFMLPFPTRSHTRRALERYIEVGERGEPTVWALVERASGRLIGDVGFGLLDPSGSDHELGYTLGRAWWGKGYATEAARACLAHGIEELGIDPVYALVMPDNEASVHVLEKIGMRPTGRRFARGADHLLFATRGPG